MQSAAKRAESGWTTLATVTARAARLCALGVLLNMGGAVSATVRIPGVLQRIALVYFLVVLVRLGSVKLLGATLPQPTAETEGESRSAKMEHSGISAGTSTVINTNSTAKRALVWSNPVWIESLSQAVRRFLTDMTSIWPSWLFAMICVGINLCFAFLLKVPGCPTGYLGPGGLHLEGKYANCTGGAAGYIDRVVFGKHAYEHATCQAIYHNKVAFDPEGLLSTLNAVATATFGMQLARILLHNQRQGVRACRFATWAVVTACAAMALCGCSKETGVIPANKNLWSLSYVFANAAICFAVYGVVYVLVDARHRLRWSGFPLKAAGLNSIALYCGHEVFAGYLLFDWGLPATHLNMLLNDVWGTLLWLGVGLFLHWKQLYFTV